MNCDKCVYANKVKVVNTIKYICSIGFDDFEGAESCIGTADPKALRGEFTAPEFHENKKRLKFR